MNLETTLAALQHAGHPFPEAAVRWAVQHREEITPALLESLRETPAQILQRDLGCFFNVFAMYLLAQFREPATYRLIIDYHAAITEAEDNLIDEVVTEDLSRILASLYPGNDTDRGHGAGDVLVGLLSAAATAAEAGPCPQHPSLDLRRPKQGHYHQGSQNRA